LPAFAGNDDFVRIWRGNHNRIAALPRLRNLVMWRPPQPEDME